MDNVFDKIRLNNCTIYINKDFCNSTFAQLLTSDEKELQKCYELTTIPSSESARVYKFTVSSDGVNREVYFKQYCCRSVLDFVKHLFRDSRAKRAFKGTLMLAENGFDVPAIAAMGERRFSFFHTEDFMVTLEVEDSKNIYEFILRNSGNLTKEQLQSKRELIRALGQTIGKMHARGIFHGDLRLGNVLAKQERNSWRFFFLDNERTKKFNRLPFELRVKNLVQVNIVRKGILSNTDRMRFFKEYWAENGTDKKQKIALIKQILNRTNRRLNEKRRCRRELRRCLRANARYLRVKTAKYLAMFNRNFCEGAEPIDFIQQIDSLMGKGQILKNDKTSYVSRLMWNGRDIAVKRYNHRGFIHSLRHTIKKSRARRGWLHAHRLRIFNIATPRPLAYIEQRKGPFVWKSYLVTEYVDGQQLYHFLRNSSVTQQQRSAVTQQVMDLLNNLSRYRISHGDLKPSNVLLTNNGPVLTDLDGMKAHKWDWIYRARQTKDIARFTKKTG